MRRKRSSSPIAWVILLVVLAIGFYRSEVWKPKYKGEYTWTESVPTATSTPSPRPTATPKPYNAYNGQILKKTDYESICPFTIEAPEGYDYYVYLQYEKAPSNSTEKRKPAASAASHPEEDIAFYLKSGQSVTIDVPVGTYKLFYAVGETFFGEKLLFGDRTRFYSSDDLLTFYTDDQYCHGHTVTLTAVVNGNFDTDPILESAFPGR